MYCTLNSTTSTTMATPTTSPCCREGMAMCKPLTADSTAGHMDQHFAARKLPALPDLLGPFLPQESDSMCQHALTHKHRSDMSMNQGECLAVPRLSHCSCRPVSRQAPAFNSAHLKSRVSGRRPPPPWLWPASPQTVAPPAEKVCAHLPKLTYVCGDGLRVPSTPPTKHQATPAFAVGQPRSAAGKQPTAAVLMCAPAAPCCACTPASVQHSCRLPGSTSVPTALQAGPTAAAPLVGQGQTG